MKILAVCTYGQNRSKYLAEYLRSKGYDAEYGGVKQASFNSLTQDKIDWADTIVFANRKIEEKFSEQYNHKDKKSITLDVSNNPAKYSKDAIEVAERS